MDLKEKLQQSQMMQKDLIAKVEASMYVVPAQQKNSQAVALKLLKDELAMVTAALSSETNS